MQFCMRAWNAFSLEINSTDRLKQGCGIMLFNHEKGYISTNTVPIATKLPTVITYHEGFLPIKCHCS